MHAHNTAARTLELARDRLIASGESVGPAEYNPTREFIGPLLPGTAVLATFPVSLSARLTYRVVDVRATRTKLIAGELRFDRNGRLGRANPDYYRYELVRVG